MTAELKCPSCGCTLYECPYPDFQGVSWWWCDLEDTYYHGSELAAQRKLDESSDQEDAYRDDEGYIDDFQTRESIYSGL